MCSCSDDALFNGIPVVLGGDFAQIPPVVTSGGRPEILGATLMPFSPEHSVNI